jgi:mannose-6-phosphate isomerase-like protein (cupin superfamily)
MPFSEREHLFYRACGRPISAGTTLAAPLGHAAWSDTAVVAFTKKSFRKPDETREYPGARIDSVRINGMEARRLIVEPGWRWSESVGPTLGAHQCPVEHGLWIVTAGRFAVRMGDGATKEFGPGDVGSIPPGHEAWVVGDDRVVGFDVSRS